MKNALITRSVQKEQPCVQLVNLARNETQGELRVVRIFNKNQAEMIIFIKMGKDRVLTRKIFYI